MQLQCALGTNHVLSCADRKLALKLHPDKCTAPGADEAFKGEQRRYPFTCCMWARCPPWRAAADFPVRCMCCTLQFSDAVASSMHALVARDVWEEGHRLASCQKVVVPMTY